jgi:hypothetical protein
MFLGCMDVTKKNKQVHGMCVASCGTPGGDRLHRVPEFTGHPNPEKYDLLACQ